MNKADDRFELSVALYRSDETPDAIEMVVLKIDPASWAPELGPSRSVLSADEAVSLGRRLLDAGQALLRAPEGQP